MEYYISAICGDSEANDGSKSRPFNSVQALFKSLKISGDGKIDFKILIENEQEYNEISKAQLKKEIKTFKTTQRKLAMNSESAHREERRTEEAVEVLSLDTNLEPATKSPINKLEAHRGHRVIVKGWVSHLRAQSKKLWFLELRDGTGSLQCVLENRLCKTLEASRLTCESSVSVYGVVREVPAGSTAQGGHELLADYWALIGGAPCGGLESVLNKDSDVDVQCDQRHLMLRGDNTSKVLHMTNIAMRAFRSFYESEDYTECQLPSLVQSQCEGGSTLFHLNYYGETAYLSQSSQLYLETMVPAVGNCYVISKSWRAEKSRTRRHLSEYTHVEAEAANITFEDLLQHIETLLVRVSELVLKIADGDSILRRLCPDYKPLKAPFRRMAYSEAIEFLREHGIRKSGEDGGGEYEFGDDIPEGAERAILAIIDEPLMLTRFPKAIKAFYMAVCEDDARVTESVDVLLPGVGEVVGGSMRIWDHEELMAAYEREGLDSKPYYWYTDQRLYGSVPHGGYGLGFERFLMWMLKKDHIRDVCSYPRYMGRCKP